MKSSNAAPKREDQEADPLDQRSLELNKAVRGKYFDRMQQGTNIILVAPDLLDTFHDSDNSQALKI